MSRPERRRASDRVQRPTQVSESPGKRRGSLRAELLFNLSFLAVAALVLALGTAAVLSVGGPSPAWVLAGLLVVDVLIFALLGNALIDRLVVRPISALVQAAEAIAGGDYGRRAVPGDSREMAALADALNRMTDQLLENQERLAENVRSLDETNRRLLATQRDLVQAEKMASVGRLAAGVAHEVGNPLGALLGYAAVLKRRGGVDPEILDGLQRESRRIDVIVRGLLDYSRPGPTHREPVDVNAAVTRVVELLRGQGRLAGVELNLRLEPDLPPVRAATHHLDQLFINLFENAGKAMAERGRLTVSTRRETYDPFRGVPVRRTDDPPGVSYAHLRRPRHSSHRDAHRIEPGTPVVRVVVADTGSGIAPEHIDTVFDPFFTTRPPGEGTGLGLAIVAATVADFGGRIEASSASGGGASFTLWLPIHDPAQG
ncbi:MAG TPA: ATP-binding protein [Longimicrobiaceae bacterium]|nr:ATP-binding protein [Longimicrobiaceae bacterium]